MLEITIAAPAKINLSLDVTGIRPDGYHLLSTVMQSIDLTDRVTVGLPQSGQAISLSCSRDGLPLDQRNTAWRAAAFFMQEAGLDQPVRIHIDKKIPLAAGLAGGSADAAAVLFGLDRLCPGRLSRAHLAEIAGRIGADVPFCLHGGTVLCEGIGDILTDLPPFGQVPVLLCKPDFGISTPWVFSRLDLSVSERRPDQAGVLDALARHDLPGLGRATANVLESVSLPAYPLLRNILARLTEAGAHVALMSGSGPTVFGLFADVVQRDKAIENIRSGIKAHLLLVAAMTLSSGPYPL